MYHVPYTSILFGHKLLKIFDAAFKKLIILNNPYNFRLCVYILHIISRLLLSVITSQCILSQSSILNIIFGHKLLKCFAAALITRIELYKEISVDISFSPGN